MLGALRYKSKIVGCRVNVGGVTYDVDIDEIVKHMEHYKAYVDYEIVYGRIPILDLIDKEGVLATKEEHRTGIYIKGNDNLTSKSAEVFDQSSYNIFKSKVNKLRIYENHKRYIYTKEVAFIRNMLDYLKHDLGLNYHKFSVLIEKLFKHCLETQEVILNFTKGVMAISHENKVTPTTRDKLIILTIYAIQDIVNLGNQRGAYYANIDREEIVDDQIPLTMIPDNKKPHPIMDTYMYNHALDYEYLDNLRVLNSLIGIIDYVQGRGTTKEFQICTTRQEVHFGKIGLSLRGKVHAVSTDDLFSRPEADGTRTLTYNCLRYLRTTLDNKDGDFIAEEIIMTPNHIEAIWFAKGVYDTTNKLHQDISKIANIHGIKIIEVEM